MGTSLHGRTSEFSISADFPRRRTKIFVAQDKDAALLVEKWMTPNPRTVPSDASISLVVMEMNRRKFRYFPVVEPISIVFKYDIARGFPANLNPLSVEVVEDSLPRPVS